jgi:hypothetical protein
MKEFRPDKALVNRLLMTLDPLFFSYSTGEQNTRRQRFDWSHSEKIYSFLYKELFGLTYDEEEDEEVLSDPQTRLLNAHTTALLGIGENSFRLCEFQSKDFDLTSFASLYDYDLAEFEYQREAWKRQSPGSWKDKDYRLLLNHDWARLLDSKGDFYYTTLSSLSRHLYDELESEKSHSIELLIPHKLVDGPNHGINTKGGILWDMKTEAYALEAQLDELKARARQYLNDVCDRLSEQFHKDSDCAVYFLKYFDDAHSPRWDVVVKNGSTAKKITFTAILSDCQKLLRPNEEIEAIKSQEVEKLKHFITEAHRDILDNFDSTVVPLKKKMKIVMSPRALDDLSRLSPYDEP